MPIKNLKKAAKRIQKAVKNKEKIIIFGDVDLDGVSSVIVLKETLKNLGAKDKDIICYFPDKNKDGYGVNKKALESLSSRRASAAGGEKKGAKLLLIALDCGITNFEEMKLAKKLEFEVMIIDHHQIVKKLPEALIIVDPLQAGDKYPFKRLATAGLVYKLSQEILGKNFSESLNRNFLELVALATLADMMPKEEENKEFIIQGLESLRNTIRPGLRVFFEIDLLEKDNIEKAVQKIISVLNTSEPTSDHLNQAYLLLTFSDQNKAKDMLGKLIEQGEQKRQKIRDITQEIEQRVSNKSEEPIIFEGDNSWPYFLAGAVASRVYNLYKKPTFIFSKKEDESRGSIRTPKDIDAVELMTKCKKHLESYGGHSRAAGFGAKNENLENFKKCLIKNMKHET